MLLILKAVAQSLMTALVTEKFLKEMLIYVLKKFAAKSDNKLDDELVAKIEEALKEQK